jgi:hypothetical protein
MEFEDVCWSLAGSFARCFRVALATRTVQVMEDVVQSHIFAAGNLGFASAIREA